MGMGARRIFGMIGRGAAILAGVNQGIRADGGKPDPRLVELEIGMGVARDVLGGALQGGGPIGEVATQFDEAVREQSAVFICRKAADGTILEGTERLFTPSEVAQADLVFDQVKRVLHV